MKNIKKLFNEFLEADVFGLATGTHGGSVGNTDFYAPGDSRIPKTIGKIYKRNMPSDNIIMKNLIKIRQNKRKRKSKRGTK